MDALTSRMFSLDGRVAFVTGGYGWLGDPISRWLAGAGAHVVVAGRDRAKYDRWREGAGAGDFSFREIDIASTESVDRAIALAAHEHGRVDVLVNNAFFGASGLNPATLDDAAFSAGLDGVLASVHRCTRAVVPFMEHQRGGSIINVASMYGVVAPDFEVYRDWPEFINPPNYGAAKAGVLALTRWFASYLGRQRIRVNAVVPGAFPSATVREHTDFVAELATRSALGRVGEPDEVGGAVVYLASDASSYVTGHALVIDGGWTIR